jgi:hypothetical protein
MEHAVYFWCALVGCTLLVAQVVLQVIGLGGEGDLDHAGAQGDVHLDGAEPHVGAEAHVGDPAHGTAGNLFFGVLSFKALVSFAAIFGLTGLSLEKADLTHFHRIALSVLAGFVAMVLVAWMMRGLHRLTSSGTVVLSDAVGRRGTVYLRIPGGRQGRGKVTVELAGRSVELNAVTDGEEIPSGQTVDVLEVMPNETVRVGRG